MNNLELGSPEWWEDVEYKVSLICSKFDNLKSWHEDLAQELRLHAYYVSTDYYNLYRKAIDFWRKIQAKQSPESLYYDLEPAGGFYVEKNYLDQFEDMVKLIKAEVEKYAQNKWEEKRTKLTLRVLDLILEDIDPDKKITHVGSTDITYYVRSKVNISWLSEVLNANYKQCSASLKTIADIIEGLAMMQKIDIPSDYLRDFYE